MAERSTKATPYEKLLASQLTDDEKAERKKASTRLSLEARRRATTVLINRYKVQFDKLYKAERAALQDDPRYQLPWRE